MNSSKLDEAYVEKCMKIRAPISNKFLDTLKGHSKSRMIINIEGQKLYNLPLKPISQICGNLTHCIISIDLSNNILIQDIGLSTMFVCLFSIPYLETLK